MVELENEPDMVVAESGEFLTRQGFDPLPIHGNAAAVGFIQCAQDMQQGAFPGSGRTHDTDDLPFTDGDIHPLQHSQLAIFLLNIDSG